MPLVIFNILANIALSIIVGMGVFAFTNSYFWAIIGSAIITGGASANPLFAIAAYPLVELIFNQGHLTIYSLLSVGINVTQMIFIYILVKKNA